MRDFRGLVFGALVACVAGSAMAQTPPARSESQARYDAAKDMYEKDMGYFADAVTNLREQNAKGGDLACRYADLSIVSLSSAQNELQKMIDIVEAAHQDAGSMHAMFNDNAEQIAQRKASYARGCG